MPRKDFEDTPSEEVIESLLKNYRRDELIELIGQAVDKWLDKKFAAFGKWSVMGLCAGAFALYMWFYVHTGGLK